METKYTSGPWKAHARVNHDGRGTLITDANGNEAVCRMIMHPREPHVELPQIVSANTDLVVAAPDLLQSALIDQALQMRGCVIATARALGRDAEDAYLIAGPSGLRNWARKKREAAIAKAEGKA